jgi:hypothetical protein
VGAPVALAVGRWRFGRLRRAGARQYALAGTLPGILWQDGWSGRGLTNVVLAYGYPHTICRPFTEVETCFADELAFALIDDLEAFFAGYRRLVRGFLLLWSK